MDRDFKKIKVPISLRALNAQREAIEAMARVAGTSGMRTGNIVSQSGSGTHVGSSVYQPFWARIVGRGASAAVALEYAFSPEANVIIVKYLTGPPVPASVPFFAHFGRESMLVTEVVQVAGSGQGSNSQPDIPDEAAQVTDADNQYAWYVMRGQLGSLAKQHLKGAVGEVNIPYAFEEVCQDTAGDNRGHIDGRKTTTEPFEPIRAEPGDTVSITQKALDIVAYERRGAPVPVDGSAIVQLWLGDDSQTYYTFSYYDQSRSQQPGQKICVSMAANPSFSACATNTQDPDKYSSWSVEMTTKPKVEGKISKDDPRIESVSEDEFSESQDDYPTWPHEILYADVTTACDLTGIAPAPNKSHVNGLKLEIMNVGTENLTLKHEYGQSEAANQFSFPGGTDVTLRPKETVALKYVSSAEKWYPLFQQSSSAAVVGIVTAPIGPDDAVEAASVTWGTQLRDTDALVNLATANTRITVPEDGWYQIWYQLSITTNDTEGGLSETKAWVEVSAGGEIAGSLAISNGGGDFDAITLGSFFEVELDANQFVEVFVQSPSAALGVTLNTGQFGVRKVD